MFDLITTINTPALIQKDDLIIRQLVTEYDNKVAAAKAAIETIKDPKFFDEAQAFGLLYVAATQYAYSSPKPIYDVYKSEYERHCTSILHKTGKRGVKKNKVNRVCQFCKLYEASCNTNLKNHILINHKTAEEREKEYPNYCKTCDYGSFSKKLFDKHLATKKHKKKEEMVKKLKDVD